MNVDTQAVVGLFCTDVEVSGSARVIGASKATVSLYGDVGTSKGRGSGSENQSGSDNGFQVELGVYFFLRRFMAAFWAL